MAKQHRAAAKRTAPAAAAAPAAPERDSERSAETPDDDATGPVAVAPPERAGLRRLPPPAARPVTEVPPEQIDTSNQPEPPKRHHPALDGERYAVPLALRDRAGVQILLDACEMFALNPEPEIFPCEVLSWTHYKATPRERRESVRLTTGGGRKLRVWANPLEPFDDETEETLRNIFGAWRVMGKGKKRVPLPLPEDLTLPYEAAVGFPASMEHQFTGGFLRQTPEERERRAARDTDDAPAA